MKRYFINFGTGAGNEYADTIEEAKRIAEQNLAYTQQNIKIIDTETEREILILRWYGVEPEEDDEVTKQFGTFGFYGEWEERI